MPCACGMRRNIQPVITKKNAVVQHNFNQKDKNEKIKILKDYINSKPENIKSDINFKKSMVKIYKSIIES
tara:strand:- start:3 stop:212 length:210 start_codon:yes stop_codon:yes gene_type:complete